jgi:hypothetical protein
MLSVRQKLVLLLTIVIKIITTSYASRDLIIGGSPAPKYEFFALPQGQSNVLCGSSLLHPDILITAAHCAIFFEGESFYIGTSKLDGSDAIDIIEMEQVLLHPNFDADAFLEEENGIVPVGSTSVRHDIALVKLRSVSQATPVAWQKTQDNIQSGDLVTVIGFGNDENAENPRQLLEGTIPVIDDAICSDIWSFYDGISSETQICAGMSGAGACLGDSGGPLLFNNRIVGIVSFGYVLPDQTCDSGALPNVYTRISGYVDFIQNGICDLSDVPPASCSGETVTSPPIVSPTTDSPTLKPSPPPTTMLPTPSPTVQPSTPNPVSRPSPPPTLPPILQLIPGILAQSAAPTVIPTTQLSAAPTVIPTTQLSASPTVSTPSVKPSLVISNAPMITTALAETPAPSPSTLIVLTNAPTSSFREMPSSAPSEPFSLIPSFLPSNIQGMESAKTNINSTAPEKSSGSLQRIQVVSLSSLLNILPVLLGYLC